MTFKTDKAVGLLLLEIFLFFLLQPSVTGTHTVIREEDPVQSSGELQKPEINLKDESYHGISIACVLPESVSDGSTCHLYTGDQPHPYKETLAIRMRSSSSTQVICIFEVSKSDLFRHLKVRRDVSCDYREDTHSLAVSPHSDGYNFTVQKPHFSSSRTEELFFFICEIPGPAGNDTICNLYVGNRKQHLLKTKIWRQKSSVSKLWFCQFTLTEDVLIRRLQSERSQEVSCDYRVSSGPNSLSPRSDGYMFTDLIASEPTTEQTSSTAGLTVLSTLTTNATRNSQTKGLTDSSTLTSDTRKSETETGSTASCTPNSTGPKLQGFTSSLITNTAVNPKPGLTVLSTLTTNATRNSQTKGLTDSSTSTSDTRKSETERFTSSLIPNTAVNPTPGLTDSSTLTSDTRKSETESVSVSSTLTTGIPQRLASTEIGEHSTKTSGNSKDKKSIFVRLLWMAAVGVASGVGVFLLGLTAVCLCGKTNKNYSQRSAQQDDHNQSLDLVMGDMMSGGLVDSGDDGKDSVISSTTSTFLPLGPIAENGPSTENENSDKYHTYCSIPDRPAASTQTEGLYSLLQIH